jgi:hypothetical protein
MRRLLALPILRIIAIFFRLPGRLQLRRQYNQLIIVTTQARNHMRKALAT